MAELLGLSFEGKIDARRLMLDYTFEGHPLLKQFPVTGYEELEYSAILQQLLFTIAKQRDDIEANFI